MLRIIKIASISTCLLLVAWLGLFSIIDKSFQLFINSESFTSLDTNSLNTNRGPAHTVSKPGATQSNSIAPSRDKADPQLSINETQFTDPAFRGCILSQMQKKGWRHASDIISLTCDNNGIRSINGIDFLDTIVYLDISGNELSEIDLSNNPALEFLYAHDNQLQSIDVYNNDSLKELYLSNNQLAALNTSNNPLLEHLDVSHNRLSEINISHNPALIQFYFEENPLSRNSARLLSSLDLFRNMLSDNMEESTTRDFIQAGM